MENNISTRGHSRGNPIYISDEDYGYNRVQENHGIEFSWEELKALREAINTAKPTARMLIALFNLPEQVMKLVERIEDNEQRTIARNKRNNDRLNALEGKKKIDPNYIPSCDPISQNDVKFDIAKWLREKAIEENKGSGGESFYEDVMNDLADYLEGEMWNIITLPIPEEI
jgi:hypothetical protein